MEQLVLGLFLFFFALEWIVESALNEINLRHARRRRADRTIPDFVASKVTDGDYQRSFEYTLAKGRFERWAELYGRILTLTVLFSGLLPLLDRLSIEMASRLGLPSPGHGILFCLCVGLIFSLASLPLDAYATFGIEGRFGFNRTTVTLYIKDKLKAFALGIVLGVPFLLGLLWLIDARTPNWWIWAFLFIMGFQLLMIVIYPTMIAPLFNRFEPLQQGELRERILALARQVGFETRGIFSMDGSTRSAHSNAYFTGLGKAKRIVLFDTLIEQMTTDQCLAVLAHEIGHYKLKHIRRMLAVEAVFLLAGLYALGWMLDFPPLFRAFGFEQPSNHVALVLFTLIAGPFTFYVRPLLNLLSRRHEYEADRFAVETLRDPKSMEEALVNLTVKNLSNLAPHPWYSAYHYSHPSPAERIAAVRACAAAA
ncbi:MAG TPA: M48 family metallopeptidase [Candidatus Eisenbacteria bacterium]|nr:M48 family metallopeptidase [Candidatus Eisenbacteria bacterium]